MDWDITFLTKSLTGQMKSGVFETLLSQMLSAKQPDLISRYTSSIAAGVCDFPPHFKRNLELEYLQSFNLPIIPVSIKILGLVLIVTYLR
jgi:hypothetical protein